MIFFPAFENVESFDHFGLYLLIRLWADRYGLKFALELAFLGSHYVKFPLKVFKAS